MITKMYSNNIKIADLNFIVHFRSCFAQKYIQDFLSTEKDKALGIEVSLVDQAILTKEALRLGGNLTLAEFSLLIEPLSNLLLRYNRFFFHSAAFLWHGKAFLFTAQSGIGKSTQLQHWLDLFPDEVEVINGDKPIIEKRGKVFFVHPSPWTGKENLSGTVSAPLGGIILLEQEKEDKICRLPAKEAVFPIFLQFLYKPTDTESVDLVCRYEQALLEQVPVWKLKNTGTPVSAQLTHGTLIEEGF